MRWRKIGLIVLLVLVGLFALTKVAEQYLELHYSEREIPVAPGIDVRFSDVNLRPYSGGVELKSVVVSDSLERLPDLSIGTVRIEGFRLWHFISTSEPRFRWLSVRDTDIELDLDNFSSDTLARLDSIHPTLRFRVLQADLSFNSRMDFKVTGSDIRNVEYRPDKGKYNLDVRKIEASEDGESLHLKGFELIPRYGKYEFSEIVGHRGGRVTVSIPDLEIKRLNWARLIRGDKAIRIHQIISHGGRVEVFTDKRAPLDSTRYVALPNEQLINSARIIEVDTVSVRGARIRYSSNNPKTDKEGFIDFREVFATIRNVTNVEDRIASRPLMSWQMRGKVFEKGELNVNIDFHLDRPDNRFVWNGNFSHTSIAQIDSFIIPVTNMNIVSGYNHGMEFAFESDQERSIGTVDFEYSSLEVESLAMKRSSQTRLLTRFANVFLLKSNNMKRNHDYHQGIVDYEHETYRDLWHYLWTSLERGIMHTVLPKNIETLVEQVQVKRKPGHIGGREIK